MINYVIGDATKPVGYGMKILTHIVNNEHKWGNGFVMAVSKRWPLARERYMETVLVMGEVFWTPITEDILLGNMVAQKGIRKITNLNPLDLMALEDTLVEVAFMATLTRSPVHMPRIGTGLAGGKWKDILPIIERTLMDICVDVYVYDLQRIAGVNYDNDD